MNKNLFKCLLVILVLFVVFFTNIHSVLAAETRCEWASPSSFVDKNKILSEMKIQIPASNNTDNFIVGILDYYTGNDKGINAGGTSVINEFLVKIDKSDDMYFGVGTLYNYTEAVISSYIDDDVDYESVGYDVTDGCTNDYIKIKCDASEKECMLYPSNAEEYKDYLSNTQFAFFNSESKNKIYNEKTILYKKHNTIPDGYFEYLSTTTVYRLKMYPSRYQNANYSRYTDYITNNFDDPTEQEEMIKALGMFIDTNTLNKRTYDDIYYNATKDKMVEIYKKEKNGGKLTGEKKNIFDKWFFYVGRNIFEEDLPLFRDMVQFIYESGDVVDIDKERYTQMIGVISSFITAKDADAKVQAIKDDSCNAICTSCIKDTTTYNGYACTQCMNTSDYKKCDKCHNETCPKGNFNNAPASVREQCLNSCLGTALSQKIKDERKKAQQEFDTSVKEMGAAALKLYKIGLVDPDELNVDFNKKYETQCKDVKNFHFIYVIIVVIGPILTIVLGSIDFARAMIANSEESMNKFRKKFPKRLIMLVLLILVPVIVHFLVTNLAGLKDSLMYCIIKG